MYVFQLPVNLSWYTQVILKFPSLPVRIYQKILRDKFSSAEIIHFDEVGQVGFYDRFGVP